MSRSITGLSENISPGPEKGQREWRFFNSLLRAPGFEGTAKNRLANLQNKILTGFFLTSLLSSIILLLNWSDKTPASLGILLLGNALFVLASFYQRHGHIERASWILVGTIYVILLFTLIRVGLGVSSVIQAALLISLAGLLLRSFNVLTVIFASLTTLLAFQSIFPSTEITQNQFIFTILLLGLEGLLLTAASHTLEQSFTEVDRSKQDILQVNKDLKDLSIQLAARTETLVAEVENRNLAEQTVLRQNRLLTAAAEIASVTTSTLDLNKLLVVSTELIQEKFEFYHASLFLIESSSNIAILRTSAGQAGHRLPVDQHQLIVGSKSLVGMATATRQPVIVMDVANHPTHLKNPLLPNTQSEAVIPLLIGELVIGALDVQSTAVDAFSAWDITILTTIANQLAIAVQNARLYTSVQQEVVERRRTEQELQFANEALEIRVNERTAELEQSVSTLHATLEATADGILVVDGQGKIVNFNQRFTEMWHIPEDIMASRKDDQALTFVLDQLVDPQAFLTKIHELYSQLESESFDTLLFKDGHVFERYSRPQRIAGQNVGRVWSFRNITERRQAEEKLIYTALHDPLTNLPNRVLFMDRLTHAMERAKRHKDYQFAVLYLDLDRFKVVNDSLGHNIGDLLLVESARRLTTCLRTEDTVARLGGDEFVILLEDVQNPLDATRIADRIQQDLALPCDFEGHKVFVSISMGIVLGAARYEQPEDVLRDADIAMYRAKGQGRGRYEMFDTTMLARAMTLLGLENDLRKAVERQEFIIHYQPIVELGNHRIVGFEALLRWQHPTRGLVSPADFIPMAEETGLIVPIGYWVLAKACSQIHEWQMEFPANPPLTISVNLSVRQCAQTDLVQKVAEILKNTGLD
ncbi:MAG: diguanylate cyclase, partial [Chloroflexi bacterium]